MSSIKIYKIIKSVTNRYKSKDIFLGWRNGSLDINWIMNEAPLEIRQFFYRNKKTNKYEMLHEIIKFEGENIGNILFIPKNLPLILSEENMNLLKLDYDSNYVYILFEEDVL